MVGNISRIRLSQGARAGTREADATGASIGVFIGDCQAVGRDCSQIARRHFASLSIADLFLRQRDNVIGIVERLLEYFPVGFPEPCRQGGLRHLVDKPIENIVQFAAEVRDIGKTCQFETAETFFGAAKQEV